VGFYYVYDLSVCCVRSFVRSFVRLLPRYLVNGLSSLNETYTEYSMALADDLIIFWKSKIKG